MNEWVNKTMAEDVKVWTGAKHWMQSAEDLTTMKKQKVRTPGIFLHEVEEPVDPKMWCALNW